MINSFKPDIDLKTSDIPMSSLNNLKEPSSANVVSSANSVHVLLNYLSNIGIPLNFYLRRLSESRSNNGSTPSVRLPVHPSVRLSVRLKHFRGTKFV